MKLVFKLVLGFIVIPILFFIYYIYSEVSYNLSTSDYIFFYTYPWITVYAWCITVISKHVLVKVFEKDIINFIYQLVFGNLIMVTISVFFIQIFDRFSPSLIKSIETYRVPLIYVCVICSIYFCGSFILELVKREN